MILLQSSAISSANLPPKETFFVKLANYKSKMSNTFRTEEIRAFESADS